MKNKISLKHKILRIFWQLIWFFFARPFPRRSGNSWKLFLLRCFNAKVSSTSVVYSSAKIYFPWNLEMNKNSCLAPNVDCYNVDKVILEENVTVSQKSFLCTASHDIADKNHSLLTKPIIIKKNAWVGADAYIGMGVTINEGAVVGARACVFKDVEPYIVVGGNPAKFLKKRLIND